MGAKEKNGRNSGKTARGIALVVTISVMAGTLIIAAVSYIRNDSDILQTILPLWGTWIGTVLAFYFGKTNFEVASKSYNETIERLTPGEKIAKLYVRDCMTEDIVFLEYDEVREKKIEDILKDERFENYNRFPIFENGIVKNIIHRSLFYEFIQLKVQQGLETCDIRELTLDDLLLQENDYSIKNKLERSLVVVSIDATLLEAKNAIETIPECEDVFVTKTGRKDEPICGLITNKMIFKEATV